MDTSRSSKQQCSPHGLSVANQLIARYNQIFDKNGSAPDWAVHKVSDSSKLVHCSIPFVGKHYPEQSVKLLVYASAENLTGYSGYLDDDFFAVNRHRAFFEKTKDDCNHFFPNVHIQPINNGCLAVSTLYLMSLQMDIHDIEPVAFYEKIAFGNYCKYTIQNGKKNLDYASNLGKLCTSREYIQADFEELQPDLVILPSTIYKTESTFINRIKGNAKVLPIYQINAGNINRHIAPKHECCEIGALHPTVARWYSMLKECGITGQTYENYRCVFSYLKHITDTWLSTNNQDTLSWREASNGK